MTGPRGQRPLGDLKIVVRPISSLKPNPRSARTHSRRQVRKIGHSIRVLGFNCPILVDDEDNILAGNAVFKAAKVLGMTTVPTVCLSHMTEAEKRAFVIAHNRLAEEAGWDRSLLAAEFKSLFEIAPELDLTITGFEFGEIEFIIDALDQAKTDALDDVAPSDPGIPVVTRHGDLWQLDGHRVLCADATQPESYARVLQGQLAQMVFADPPYNVPIDGHVSGLGQVKHADFPMASGEMSEDEFTAFLTTPLEQIRIHSADGAIAFACMDWRHYRELLVAARAAKLALKNLVVWVKTNAGMGTFYRSRHELIAVFKVGTAPHINNFELGQHGRYRTNVWTYPGVNSFGTGRDDAIAMHPTVKPVALVADAIKDCSRRNGLILDPFLGSGTTVIAAELTGRRAAGFELDPRYVDTIIRRWQRMTGKDAVLVATGEAYETVANVRGAEPEEAATCKPK